MSIWFLYKYNDYESSFLLKELQKLYEIIGSGSKPYNILWYINLYFQDQKIFPTGKTGELLQCDCHLPLLCKKAAGWQNRSQW